MARFETWSEVARLFFGAACVGVLLILLLTAEAKKIEEREEALVAEPENEKVVAEAGDISPLNGFRTVWSKLRQFIRLLVIYSSGYNVSVISYSKDDTSEEAGKRQKREVASEDFYSFPIREDLEEEISTSSGKITNGLSSALLTSALDGHKVKRTRNTDFREAKQLRFVIWMKRLPCSVRTTLLSNRLLAGEFIICLKCNIYLSHLN